MFGILSYTFLEDTKLTEDDLRKAACSEPVIPGSLPVRTDPSSIPVHATNVIRWPRLGRWRGMSSWRTWPRTPSRTWPGGGRPAGLECRLVRVRRYLPFRTSFPDLAHPRLEYRTPHGARD